MTKSKKYTPYWVLGLIGVFIVAGLIGWGVSNSYHQGDLKIIQCNNQLKDMKCPTGQACMPEPMSWICQCAGGTHLSDPAFTCKIGLKSYSYKDICDVTQDSIFGMCYILD